MYSRCEHVVWIDVCIKIDNTEAGYKWWWYLMCYRLRWLHVDDLEMLYGP